MAALQLVRDAAEQCDAGMAVQLHEAVAPRLAALLRHSEPVLQSGALRAGASLLSAALEAGRGPMSIDGAAGTGAAPADGGPREGEGEAALLGGLKGVLDVGSAAEFDADLEDAALDAGRCPGGCWRVWGVATRCLLLLSCSGRRRRRWLLAPTPSACAPAPTCTHPSPAVGILGMHASGAEALLSPGAAGLVGDVAYKALGRAPSPTQRLAALHALAAVAGAERTGRSAKLLGPEAEVALRVAVFEGGQGGWSFKCGLLLAGSQAG